MNDFGSRLAKAFTTVVNVAVEQVVQAAERGVSQIEEAVAALEEQTRAQRTEKTSTSATNGASQASTAAPATRRRRRTKANRTSNHNGPRPLSAAKIRQIQSLAAEGKTIKQIADEAGVSTSSAQRYRTGAPTPRS